MKLDLMNTINKAVEEVSEKAELVKQNASAGWDKASEYAKEVVNNAAIVTKDVAVKANEGLNAGIETVGEKIHYRKAVAKASEEIGSVVKSLDAVIGPNMDPVLSEKMSSLSVRLKSLLKTIKKSNSEIINSIEQEIEELGKEKQDLPNVIDNEFNKKQLIKYYTSAINACNEAYELIKEVQENELIK